MDNLYIIINEFNNKNGETKESNIKIHNDNNAQNNNNIENEKDNNKKILIIKKKIKLIKK